MEKSIKTKNNIDLYYLTNKHLHSICLSVYIRYGSMFEVDDAHGISHFYEHIFFRNINKMMDGEMYKILDLYGISFNGRTYKEFVMFEFSFPQAGIDIVTEILNHLFKPIILSSQEIEMERKRVKAEIYEEDEKNTLSYIGSQEVWKNTTLANLITGTCSCVNKIGKQKLNEFRNKFFSIGNFFLYVTGKAMNEDIVKIKNVLENHNFLSDFALRDNNAPIPYDFQNRACRVLIKDSNYCYAKLHFDFRTSECSKAEQDLLYSVLFSGDSCKFYQELSENQGLIYSFDARLEVYENIGNMNVFFEFKQGRYIEIFTEVVKILNSIKRCDFSLKYFKPEYCANADVLLDNCRSLNWEMAFQNHILNHYDTFDSRKAKYENVTEERIAKIASQIFISENLVIALKGKKKGYDEKIVKEIFYKLDC